MTPNRKTTTGFATNPAAQQALAAAGFPAFRVLPTAGRLASVLPGSWRGGIYVFECEDGEGYVGQTSGALSTRLSAHRRNVAGIRAVTFLRTALKQLNTREREVHALLERAGVRLKTLSFARLEPGARLSFSDVLSEEEQRDWLASPRLIIADDERPMGAERTAAGDALFERFAQHHAAPWMIRAMARYVWMTLPNPRLSERTYWGVTLRLEKNGSAWLRLNVGVQTVLDLYGHTGWRTEVCIFAPRVRFERAFDCSLPSREAVPDDAGWTPFSDEPALSTLACVPSWMVDAGKDQFHIIGPCEQMLTLLERESWLLEARAMHLDMMQRNKNINGRSHNAAVGDAILDIDFMALLQS